MLMLTFLVRFLEFQSFLAQTKQRVVGFFAICALLPSYAVIVCIIYNINTDAIPRARRKKITVQLKSHKGTKRGPACLLSENRSNGAPRPVGEP